MKPVGYLCSRVLDRLRRLPFLRVVLRRVWLVIRSTRSMTGLFRIAVQRAVRRQPLRAVEWGPVRQLDCVDRAVRIAEPEFRPGVESATLPPATRWGRYGTYSFARSIDVYTFRNAILSGRDGAVFTPDGKLIARLSHHFGHFTMANPRLAVVARTAPQQRATNCATVATTGGASFYHWLFEVVPRLIALRRAGVHLNELDHLFYTGPPQNFQRETLPLLDCRHENWVPCDDATHVQLETLHVPSRLTFTAPSTTSIAILREALLPRALAKARDRWWPRLLHISRRHAPTRHIVNDAQLTEMLGRNGFTSLSLEDYPLADQIRCVHSADVIVAEHGAGLALMPFFSPAASVLELVSPLWPNPLYWHLAQRTGVRYSYVRGRPQRMRRLISGLNHGADFAVDVAHVERSLDVT